MLALFLKALPYLMPFIKEMLIGKKTWKQAFKENKFKTIFAISGCAAIVFNLFLMVKIGTLAFSVLELQRAKQELEKRNSQLEAIVGGLPSSKTHPVASNTEVVSGIKGANKSPPQKTTSNPSNNVDDIRAEFERMRQRESGDH
jgi:hypothetical protein